MKPEREPRNNARNDHTLQATGPLGLVPQAFHEARSLYLQGRIPEALSRLEDLFLPDGTGSKDDLRNAALLRAWCLIEKREHDLCRQWLVKARLRGHLPADDPGADIIELNIQLFQEKYAQVREAAAAMLAHYSGSPNLDQAELRMLLGAALRWEGKTREAVPHLEYAGSAFLVLEEPGRAAVAANFLGWTLLSLGRLAEAGTWFDKSLKINTELNAPLRMAQNFQNLAIVHYKQSRYAEARDYLQQELELIDSLPDMQCRALIAKGNVERLQGEYHASRGDLLKAYTLAGQNGLMREEVLALEFLGDVFRDEMNPAQAQRYYRRGLSLARSLAPEGDLVMELLRRQGECLDLEGHHEQAQHVLNSALEYCGRVGDEHEAAVTLRCLGINSANLGRWSRAILQLEQARDELKKLGAHHETMVAGYHLARLLIRRLDTGNATMGKDKVLDRAWEIALSARQENLDLDTTYLAAELKDIVNDLARRRHLQAETSPKTAGFSAERAPSTRIVAVSRAMQQVLRQSDGFAACDNPVLISGECGSSKELLACRIHENSPRGKKSLVRVSCAASNEDLLAHQLFGQTEAQGLVTKAQDSTLLLANIDELPNQLQDKIVRLMTHGSFQPTGDSGDHQANVRIIATSSRDLGLLVREKRFRPDLYFRLRLMTIQVPPLRSRPEDTMPLLDHFLSRLEGSTLSAHALFDFPSLEALTTYDWPGGTAELESIAQRAWLNRKLGRAVALQIDTGSAGSILEFAGDDPGPAGPGHFIPPKRHPSGMTWSSLNSLIVRTGGNKARTARNLGVSRITLYRWLKQLKPQD
ncbi:MAG: sigma 54-interacting transcriptional regulator [Gemmatimonadales bacterium]|nr:sigma 54-interacting transcriptional regulator [Gemmatimonadales bacterium]